jgi:hypothetical protein
LDGNVHRTTPAFPAIPMYWVKFFAPQQLSCIINGTFSN